MWRSRGAALWSAVFDVHDAGEARMVQVGTKRVLLMLLRWKFNGGMGGGVSIGGWVYLLRAQVMKGGVRLGMGCRGDRECAIWKLRWGTENGTRMIRCVQESMCVYMFEQVAFVKS